MTTNHIATKGKPTLPKRVPKGGGQSPSSQNTCVFDITKAATKWQTLHKWPFRVDETSANDKRGRFAYTEWWGWFHVLRGGGRDVY